MNEPLIAVFGFRRPTHFARLLESLSAQNANRTLPLWIFVDGPGRAEDEPQVAEVRVLANAFRWAGEKECFFRTENKGLSRSIVDGIDQAFQTYERVVILEDDIELAPGFLAYMTTALDRYASVEDVGGVSGYGPPVDRPAGESADGYFTKRLSTWAWGTWRRTWALRAIDWGAVRTSYQGNEPDWSEIGWDLRRYLGSSLDAEVGENIWSPLLLFPLYRAGKLTLWPYESFATNTGLDGSGTNSGSSADGRTAVRLSRGEAAGFRFPSIARPDPAAVRSFVAVMGPPSPEKRKGLLQRLKSRLKTSRLVGAIYYAIRQGAGMPPRSDAERAFRLARLAAEQPRYVAGEFDFGSGKMHYVDAISYYYQFREIFLDRCYEMSWDGVRNIVDCGGNVGLSAVWFRSRYPRASIDVFEADPFICRILKANLTSLGISDVHVHPFAVSDKAGTALFCSDHADGGRLVAQQSASSQPSVSVETVRLSEWIKWDVDLLKLDVEGAEFAVIEELARAGALTKIRNLVVEVHVVPETREGFARLLQSLDEHGFGVALGPARAQPDLFGQSPRGTRFSAVTDEKYVILVYAWRSRRGVATRAAT